MDSEPPRRRPSVSQLSKTPSWLMLGFILGAIFVWALPRKTVPPPRPILVAPPQIQKVVEPRELTTVEAVFERWSDHAVWDNDVTQIALWNGAVGEFAEFYEVRRVDGAFYFRSIANLTNRVIRHGKPLPAECPLRFTETPEQYRDWVEQGRYERPPENIRPSLPVERPATPRPKPSVETRAATLPAPETPQVEPNPK